MLLIITDGAITDTQNTIDAIVAATEVPLSIIIVGVGYVCDAGDVGSENVFHFSSHIFKVAQCAHERKRNHLGVCA